MFYASELTPNSVLLGLRKVTDSMKTHKNPELRASSIVKASDKQAAKITPKAATAAAAVKKPPVCELQGKKWVVVSLHALCTTQDFYLNMYDPPPHPTPHPGISRWQQ